MTWRWNAFSIRFTPTRPSRTSRELRRDGIAAASCPDHVCPSDPVLKTALLAVEPHPEKAEEQRGDAREVATAPRDTARGRRPFAVDIDDLHLQHAHAERAPDDDLEHQQVGEADREEHHDAHHERRI